MAINDSASPRSDRLTVAGGTWAPGADPSVAVAPHIVGIGGTMRDQSSSEYALRFALGRAEELGATTRAFTGDELSTLPMYVVGRTAESDVGTSLIDHLRRADGVIISSPGYHGSVSGLVKNALDYTEDMRDDPLPYLSRRGVGLISSAYGWQATVTTLVTLRSIVHSLRGWVTPFGAAINSLDCTFVDGRCNDPRVEQQIGIVVDEVIEFARMAAPGAKRSAGPPVVDVSRGVRISST